MRILRQVAIIFSICVVCEGLSTLFPFPFPGSVLSMLVMLVLLFSQRLKLSDIQETADLLLNNMMLVFVPPFISVMNYLDVLKSIALQFIVIIAVSTVLTFWVASSVVRLVFFLQSRGTRKEDARDA